MFRQTTRFLSRRCLTRHFPIVLLAISGTLPGLGPAPCLRGQDLADDRVRFLVLEELERREQFLGIREKLLEERGAWETLSRDAEETHRLVAQIPRLSTDDEKVLAGYRVHRRILEAIDALADCRQRLLELISTIDAAGREAAASPSIATYVNQARSQTGTILAQATATQGRLQKLDLTVKRLLRAVPPPPSFVTSTGLTMQLVGRGSEQRYVSETAISIAQFTQFLKARQRGDADAQSTGAPDAAAVTGISWFQARAFCSWLSESESHAFRLPELAELRLLGPAGRAPSMAVWSSSPWRHEEPRQRAMAERFGITMLGVWDPHAKLDPTRVFPELPFATHPDLGFLVLTSPDTGRVARWNRLKQQLDQ